MAEGDDIKYARTDKIFSLVGRKVGGTSNMDDNQLYAPLGTGKVPGFENQKVKKIRYFVDKTSANFNPLRPQR